MFCLLQLHQQAIFLLKNHISFSSTLVNQLFVVLQLNFELVDNLSPFLDLLFIISLSVINNGALRHG